jgi:molybdopterin-guanine dinucleotide biosynthesis protein A
MINAYTGMILAGGHSTRMGQDKALLPVLGVPLLQRTCQIAQQCCASVYVVTHQAEQYRRLVPHGCQLIPEAHSDSKGPGPLVAFWQALPQVQTEWVLLLACDLPYLDGGTIRQWQLQLETIPQSAIACLARPEQIWEPLCGFYRRSCYDNLTTYVKAGGRSFQGWLRQAIVAQLRLDDPLVLTNCNTPADWQRVKEAIGQGQHGVNW